MKRPAILCVGTLCFVLGYGWLLPAGLAMVGFIRYLRSRAGVPS